MILEREQGHGADRAAKAWPLPIYLCASSSFFFSSSCLASLVRMWSELIRGQCKGKSPCQQLHCQPSSETGPGWSTVWVKAIKHEGAACSQAQTSRQHGAL